MNIRLFILGIIAWTAIASTPIILISGQGSPLVLNSEELLEHIKTASNVRFIELAQTTTNQIQTLSKLLKDLGISKERISSFMTDDQKFNEFKEKVANFMPLSEQTLTLKDLRNVLSQKDSQNIILRFAPVLQSRILQNTNGTVDSKMFNAMTPYALSGLLVSLFLLVMLCIALSCLYDLKTNDRFARQNLWVGRES